MLLGLLREKDSAAVRLLTGQIGVFPERIQAAVEAQLKPEGEKPDGDQKLTQEAKLTIDRAYEESQRLGNNYIDSEHLLLGLIGSKGLAAEALAEAGVTLDETRREAAAMQVKDR